MTCPPFTSPSAARRSLSALLHCLTVLLLPLSAHAQDMTEAGAQLLDAEGTALLNQRKLAAACPKLERSFRLKPGTGVLLRLALCQELSGKWASSVAHYLDAAKRADAAGDQQIEQLAKNRAAALQPRLAHLTVDLDSSVATLANLRLWCDGTPLESTTLGAGLPLDPGTHVIEAVAPGRRRFEETIVVSDEPRRYSVTILLPVDAVPIAAKVATKPQHATTDTERSFWSPQRSLALVAGGVGVAGVTAGTFLGLAVGSHMHRARALCVDGQTGCSDEALLLQDQARGYALASTIAFAAGAAGILGGIALWVTAPEQPPSPGRHAAQVRVVPIVGIGSGGIQAVGTW